MIAEYHLTSHARVSQTMSPVLPEAAKLLLPAIKTYVSNISFGGYQGREGLGPCQDPPSSHLAISFGHGSGVGTNQPLKPWTCPGIAWDAS